MSTESSSTHTLQAGQAMHLPLAGGDAVVVTRGSVRLHAAPQWMAERVLAAAFRLEEGEHQLIESPGWVVIEAASGDACVCIAQRQHAVPARPGWAPAWLRRLAF